MWCMGDRMDAGIVWEVVKAFIVGYVAYSVIGLLVSIVGFFVLVWLLRWLFDRI